MLSNPLWLAANWPLAFASEQAIMGLPFHSRGVQIAGTVTTTSARRGVFLDDVAPASPGAIG